MTIHKVPGVYLWSQGYCVFGNQLHYGRQTSFCVGLTWNSEWAKEMCEHRADRTRLQRSAGAVSSVATLFPPRKQRPRAGCDRFYTHD